MRIRIDATPLLLRSAGVKNYLYYWIRSLQRTASADTQIEAFPYLRQLGALNHDGSVTGYWSTWARIGLLRVLNRLAPAALESISRGLSVFHCSNQLRTPLRRIPMTATLYDVTPLLMPEHHTAANVAADRNYTERIIKRARGLIAISQNTRNDAARYLGLQPETITVIYPGVPESFFLATEAQAAAIATEYRLTRPYVLFVGTLEPRKNIDMLLDAWLALPRPHREEHDLVIAGPVGWAKESTLGRLRTAGSGIRALGYVPEDSLPGLTKGALALAYPSLYEGFGFPLAQAMAAGVPAITSTTSCLPEVAGDGALTVDPRSLDELRTALDAVITSASLRARLAAAGRERAASLFRWERCARESIEFFRRVAG